MERCDGVVGGESERLTSELRLAAGNHSNHPQTILGQNPLAGGCLDHLAGIAHRRQIAVDVSRADRHAVYLRHDGAGVEQVIVRQSVGQFDQVADVLQRRAMRRAGGIVVTVEPADHRLVVQRLRRHVYVVGWVAGIDSK